MNASQTLHPTDQTLHAYGLGKLDDALAESVNQHVESCSDCQRRVAELSSDSFLGRLRDAQGRPDSAPPIMSSTDGLSMLAAGPRSPAPPPADTLPPGLADHPDYEITRELGRGGMGVVYMARNTLMGRTEVLKVVSSHLINRRGVLDRFLAEIRNAARLHHPNIVTAYSVLRVGESLVLAMEYVEGLDLAQMVKARGPLPVAHACNYVHQAALGLQHAHEHGMVHRDIKPSNLMLARQGNRALIKVLDFGLAKVQSEGAVDGGLTHEGQMLGTPDYIAPEQISDARRADIRADIYSLGCTLYYLLTGGPPFQGTSLYDILQAHHSMDAKPLNLARPEVPVELAALVAKMMAKEPERRFQTPKEVAQALTPFFKKGGVASGGPKPEFSQAGQTDARPAAPRAGSVPARSAAELAPAPGSSVRKPATTASPDSLWESLVVLRGTERSQDKTPASASPRRPRWLWPVAAIGLLLLGFVAVWGVLIKIWTPEGFIVLKDLPDQAMVVVDGKKADVHWLDEGGRAEITVTPGEHDVQVKKDGFTMKGGTVRVERGGKRILTVQLEPLESPPPKKGDANGSRPPPEVDKRPGEPTGKEVVAQSPTPPPTPAPNSGTQATVVAGNRAGKVDAAGGVANEPAQTQATDAARVLRGKAEILSGRWLVEGRELVQTGLAAEGTGGAVLFGDVHWTDYDFTVDLLLTDDPLREKGHDCLTLLFRRTPEGNNLGFGICAGDRDEAGCGISAFEDGKERGLKQRDFRFVKQKWHHARVSVQGNHIVCTLHDDVGKQVVHLPAVDGRHPSGQVGLDTENSAFRFKNIKVTDPDGKTLWEMPPAIGELPGQPGGKGNVTANPVERPAKAPVRKLPVPPAAERAVNVPVEAQTDRAAGLPNRIATKVSGEWGVDGDELTGKNGVILLGNLPLSSYDIKFKAQIVRGDRFCAIFHHTRPGDYCMLEVGDNGGTGVTLQLFQNGKRRSAKGKAIRTVPGRWYDVRIEVRGPKYAFYRDDILLFTDSDDHFTIGRVGLWANPVVLFKDIVITTPDRKPLWEGPPNRLAGPEGEVLWESSWELPSQVDGHGAARSGAVERPAQALVATPPMPPAVKGAVNELAQLPAKTVDLLPAGGFGRGAVWAYTTKDPGPRWKESDFNDKDWLRGPIGFVARTKTIWLRAMVSVDDLAPEDILNLRERGRGRDFAVFVNGRVLYCFTHLGDSGSTYNDYLLGPTQKTLFRPGINVIAVTSQYWQRPEGRPDPQGLDVGLTLTKGDKDAETRDGRFLPLFAGKDLTGWRGLEGYWRVEVGALIGSPPAKNRNSTFLVSERKYRDFELRFKVLLKDGIGNSGVQFRSKVWDEKVFSVRGPRCDIPSRAPAQRGQVLYGAQLVSEMYRKGDFNQFSIKCVGKHLAIMVNGYNMADGDFPSMPDEGLIAWELDGRLPPKEAVFKDVEIRELGARR
jgi:serine/threonine protein kinase